MAEPSPPDWGPLIQGLAVLCAAIGSAIAYVFGNKKSKQPSPLESRYDEEIERLKRREEQRINEHDEEIERLRISEAERIKAISDLNDERIRRDFAAINDATRQSVRDEIARLESMINRNQNDISVLKVVVGLKSKHED